MSTQSHKRWRLAFAIIFTSRAFVRVVKQIISTDPVLDLLSRSPSYTSIDVIQEERAFQVDLKDLIDTVKEKNLELLSQLGGVDGIVSALQTDGDNGISGSNAEISLRRDVFGSNKYQKASTDRFLHFVWEKFKDYVTLIELACAVPTVIFVVRKIGVKEGWYAGGSTIIALFIVVFVCATIKFVLARQFNELSSVTDNIQVVDVVRDKRQQTVSIFDVVVGDVVLLKTEDLIPADGLFLKGHSLKVDESAKTGSVDETVEVDVSKNPFLLSGSKVVNGYGSMIITAVGMDTALGEVMRLVSSDSSERTPLQEQLAKLTSYILKIGSALGSLVLVELMICYFTGKMKFEKGDADKFKFSKNETVNDLLNTVVTIVSDAATVVFVAIPEGLSLALKLTLAYSMNRMMIDKAIFRKLSACETMGSATTICTDLTMLNQMKVTEFFLGQEAIKDEEVPSKIGSTVLELLHQGVGLNTSGRFYVQRPGITPEFSGSPTEIAILSWAVLKLRMNMEDLKQSCMILPIEAFHLEKQGISTRKKNENINYVHWKGEARTILGMCSSYCGTTGVTQTIDEAQMMKFQQIIEDMSAKTRCCIGFAYGQFQEEDVEQNDGNITSQMLMEEGLTLLALVGLEDSCRLGVRNAVLACIDAGVNIKMITGHDVFTARAIATQCGILNPNQELNSGAVVEGLEFRNSTVEEQMEMVERISVMASSLSSDKLMMVKCLKEIGHVVAVTGDGISDAPALKEADIGLSTRIQGTAVAKESSDIVILDDNFASVFTVLRWGRGVYSNIQKFVQFQLTVIVAALVVNFIAAVSMGEVPLTAVQLLWVNLIMDTLGAFALATDQPTEELMERPPVSRKGPLITNLMLRNVIGQSLYQITVILILQFKGMVIFRVNENVNETLRFTVFVFCQIFNLFNARKPEKKNVFEGVLKNKLFPWIVGIISVLQFLMVEFLKKFANTERLNWWQLGTCIGIAAVSWPIDWVMKCLPVPDKQLFSLSCFHHLHL